MVHSCFSSNRLVPWSISVLAACGGVTPVPAQHGTAAAPSSGSAATIQLPVVMEEHRWLLQTTTAAGAPLRIYLDSAGGMYITKVTAARLQLPIEHVRGEGGEGDHDEARFPELVDRKIPTPKLAAFPVLDEDDEFDAMFGAPWFAPLAVTFDYPRQQLLLRALGDLPEVAPEHWIAVAFPRNARGVITSPYGRIQMTVDGQPIDMLLDTGATVDLTESAIRALGGTARLRATSFITDTVFQRWRKVHPEWRVIEGADHNAKRTPAPMIEVPKLTVAGYEVGPVWFTWRPDHAFHEFMAQFMDRATEGALGGSAFASLRISVDWPGGAATFER